MSQNIFQVEAHQMWYMRDCSPWPLPECLNLQTGLDVAFVDPPVFDVQRVLKKYKERTNRGKNRENPQTAARWDNTQGSTQAV